MCEYTQLQMVSMVIYIYLFSSSAYMYLLLILFIWGFFPKYILVLSYISEYIVITIH